MVALLPQYLCSSADKVSLVTVVAVDNMEISFSWNDQNGTRSQANVASRPRGYKNEYSLKLKIKRDDWLLADMCLQATNRCALIWVWEWTQVL